MRFGHAPFPRHAPHIEAALLRAASENADGVLSAFRLLKADRKGSLHGGGFVFGRDGYPDESPMRTSIVESVELGLITTTSGRRYVIADYFEDAERELNALKNSLSPSKSSGRGSK